MLAEPAFVSPDAHYSDLSTEHPREILEWAASTVERLALATSFQSSGLVILHLLREIRQDIPVLFLDTGFHFEETLAFAHEIRNRWNLDLVEVRGEHGNPENQARLHGEELYRRDPDRCCFINKVEPLQKELERFDAWISGIRRDQSPLRAGTPFVEAQMLRSGKEVLKIHPLAGWTREQVAEYVTQHSIPTHPLLEQGYASIGCWPCTRAINAGEAERAGRWNGFTKTECGIHSFGKADQPRQTEAEQ